MKCGFVSFILHHAKNCVRPAEEPWAVTRITNFMELRSRDSAISIATGYGSKTEGSEFESR
jgi:hypothetical protein